MYINIYLFAHSLAVIFEIKHRYRCFIAEQTIGTCSGAYELTHECASTSALITRTRTSTDSLFCDKTRVPMFYFDSKTAIPIVSL